MAGHEVRNWAGNVTFTPYEVAEPTSVGDLQEIVRRAPRVKAIGTRHSFSDVADTTGVLVSLEALPHVIDIDSVSSTVTVGAGIRWGELAPVVHAAGFALHTMGSLPHISVGGSVATGTHGSGDRNGCLATAVSRLEIVDASGEVRRLDRGSAELAGSVVALGALGVVTALTLDLQPTYDVRQDVYDGLSWRAMLDHLDDILASASSVSLFTRWRGAGAEQVWVKQRVDDEPTDLGWTGAVPADGPRHPVPGMAPESCTVQGGEPGPWFERVPHFRLDFTPSSGAELQTEYLVAREHGRAALEAVDGIRDRVAPVLQIGEIRSVAADSLWLSPAHGRDSLAIHFTWIADTARVLPVVAAVEAALAPFAPRPHWGKVFTTEPEALAPLYERLPDFRRLVRAHDPEGKFRNAFLDRWVLSDQ